MTTWITSPSWWEGEAERRELADLDVPTPANGPEQRYYTQGFYPASRRWWSRRFPAGEYTARELIDADMWRAAEATPYDRKGLWHSRSHP